MNRGKPLYELQNLDLELENGQRRLAEIQANLGETKALVQARASVSAAEAKRREWLTKIRDLELEIESLGNKISASEQRLYSGRITNPKELSDIQEEVTSLKRRRSVLEDQLLESMVQDEEAQATLDHCRQTLADINDEWQADQAALKEEFSQLEARMAEAREAREQLRGTIDPTDLETYDKVKSRCGTMAVATMRDGVCGFCSVAPSSTKLKRILSGHELLLCGNCGRILIAP